MDEINEYILNPEIPNDDKINRLKSGRDRDFADLKTLKDQWGVDTHKVFDDAVLPKKKIVNEDQAQYLKDVNRIPVPFQKIIVNKAVAFAFNNPVTYNYDYEDNPVKKLFGEAFTKVDKKLKLKSHNRRIYRELLRATEVAECWFCESKPEYRNLYGLDNVSLKLRTIMFSPFKGDTLYPYFKDGDLIAFGREFIRKNDEGRAEKVFEVYTDKICGVFVSEEGSQGYDFSYTKHTLGKIPVVYGALDEPEADWEKVQHNIERLEFLLSKFAEINDYHAAPKLVAKGQVMGFADKGESGSILEIENDGDLKYLDWNNATDSVKLEIETCFKVIFTMTQTADISFESVKGIGAISGTSLKMLLSDAHLKVGEYKEIMDDFLQRRVNIVSKFLLTALNNPKDLVDMDIEPEINPYSITDETTLISDLYKATGQQGFMSIKTAAKVAGYIEDADSEVEQIMEEERARNTQNSAELTI